MSLCVSCGLMLSGDAAICAHHHSGYSDNWAAMNRIMCDFFHRGVPIPRLSPADRDDDFWATSADA